MSLTRRSFLGTLPGKTFGPGGALVARGREALEAELWPSHLDAASLPQLDSEYIWIHSNENPLGPGPRAIEALMRSFQYAGRYPMNARPGVADLRSAIGGKFGVKPENVVLGAGSGEILRNAVLGFTSATRPLVTAAPSFENPDRMARQIGTPVKALPVDVSGRLDVQAMASAAKGAGLVFLCNPNNPTATAHGARVVSDFVMRIRRESPTTAILIDEAYYDYVTDPDYATAAPLALEYPNVFIARTFSKAYGMAGLRSGYAVGQTKTIQALFRHATPYNQNTLVLGAALASLEDPQRILDERTRNTDVRAFTVRFFESLGYTPTESQANFIFVDIRRSAKEFRDACGKQRVMIGRDFPPLDRTHVRISIGTMDEMLRATEVFRKILATRSDSASQRG